MLATAILEQRPDRKVQALMATGTPPIDGNTPGERPPGPNPLFFGVLGDVAAGVLAGVQAGSETLLGSNVVFRFAVGGAVAAVLYAVTVATWLAWHRRTFKKLGIGPAQAEVPDAAKAAEVRSRDIEVAEFMGTTTQAVEDLGRRVESLEQGQSPDKPD